jgi:hypothetical protein
MFFLEICRPLPPIQCCFSHLNFKSFTYQHWIGGRRGEIFWGLILWKYIYFSLTHAVSTIIFARIVACIVGGRQAKFSKWQKKFLNLSWHMKPQRCLVSGKWRCNKS